MVSGCQIYMEIGQNFSLQKTTFQRELRFDHLTSILLLPDDDNLVAGEDKLGNDG